MDADGALLMEPVVEFEEIGGIGVETLALDYIPDAHDKPNQKSITSRQWLDGPFPVKEHLSLQTGRDLSANFWLHHKASFHENWTVSMVFL